MNLFEKIDRKITPYSNIILFILVFCFIFINPFMHCSWQQVSGQIFFSVIFFCSIFVLETGRKKLLYFAIVAFITEWTAYWINMPLLYYLSISVNILFFQVIVIKIIIQIARSKKTDASVIFESINGYLMMGLMFTSWVAIAMLYDPAAFSFYSSATNVVDFSYFTFVTMTTLGYGDVTPQLPYARSLSILISTSGQIYIAVIIAMLVGKYAGTAGREKE